MMSWSLVITVQKAHPLSIHLLQSQKRTLNFAVIRIQWGTQAIQRRSSSTEMFTSYSSMKSAKAHDKPIFCRGVLLLCTIARRHDCFD